MTAKCCVKIWNINKPVLVRFVCAAEPKIIGVNEETQFDPVGMCLCTLI